MVPTFSDWQISLTFPVFSPFAIYLTNTFPLKNQRKNKNLNSLTFPVFLGKIPSLSSILGEILWLFQSVQYSLTFPWLEQFFSPFQIFQRGEPFTSSTIWVMLVLKHQGCQILRCCRQTTKIDAIIMHFIIDYKINKVEYFTINNSLILDSFHPCYLQLPSILGGGRSFLTLLKHVLRQVHNWPGFNFTVICLRSYRYIYIGFHIKHWYISLYSTNAF